MNKREQEYFYFSSLNKDELRKMQLKLLNILEIFDEFCNKNNLRYYLAAGTCLGAVREGCFIPWDDDLDVIMPRDDFEKLFKIWDNKDNRYQLLRPTKDMITGVHIGLLRDSDTTCIYEYAREYNICHGMKIDIEVLDSCPNSFSKRRIQHFFCLVYGIMSAQRVPNTGSIMRKILAKIILGIIRSKSIRNWFSNNALEYIRKFRIDECRNVRVNYSSWLCDKEVFGEPVMKKFEGKLYPVPTNYDLYLTHFYGDYMSLPPEADRKPHTKCYFYDPDTSYIKYYGIKYCVLIHRDAI